MPSCTAGPSTAPRASRSSGRSARGGLRCWRSTCRAPARCVRRCPTRSSSSSRRRAGTSWCAGWSGAAPRAPRSGRPGWRPPGASWPPRTEFDAIVVNDDVRRAGEELVSLMADAGRARVRNARVQCMRSVVPASAPPHRLTRRNETHRVRNRGRPHRHHQPADRRPARARADSKYALVIYSAKRARQINAYYSQLQEGLLDYVGPLVETEIHEKPLSIALREINEGLLTSEPTEADRPRARPRMRIVLGVSGRHRRLQGRARCCACSPSPVTTSPSCPPRPRCTSSGPPTWSALSGQPVATDVWTDVARGAARALGQERRPRRRRPGHRRPARQGGHGLADDLLTDDPAHRALPGRLRAGHAHRDVGAPGHPGQRRHAAQRAAST